MRIAPAATNRIPDSKLAAVRTEFHIVHSRRKRVHKAAASGVPGVVAASALLSGTLKIIVTRSEEHTSELQSLMRISYAVFCLKKKIKHTTYSKTDKTVL